MKPLPTQQLWLDCTFPEVLFTGMHGCGKTWALLVGALRAERSLIVTDHPAGVRCLIDQAGEIAEAQGLRPKCTITNGKLTLSTGAHVQFAGGVESGDFDRVTRGRRFDYLGVDRISYFPHESTYCALVRHVTREGRVRATHATAPTGWIQDCGPGTPWVMERFMGGGLLVPRTPNAHLPEDFVDRLRPFAWRSP